MNKKLLNTYFMPVLLIIVLGLLLVAIVWLSYVGIYLFVEQVIYHGDYAMVPADLLRNLSTLTFCIITFFVMKSQAREVLKAIFLVGAFTTVVISVMLRFYIYPWTAVIITAFIAGLLMTITIYFKKPWFYYLAIFYSVFIGLLYAWPQL